MSPRWRAAAQLALPEAPVLLATALLVRVPSWHSALTSLARFYPAVAFGIGAFLALRYRRGRLLFCLVALALAAWGPWWAGTPDARRLAFDAVAVLLPLNLLVLALLADRGIFTPAGLGRWGALAAQAVGVATLGALAPLSGDAVFRASVFSEAAAAWLRLPPPAIWAFVVAASLLVVLAVREPQGPGRGTLWALAVCALGLTLGKPGVGATVALSSAVLVLSVAVIETAHHQVYHDALTGLPGRRALDEEMLRLGDRYVIAMVDVDHFKNFNDTFGHDVGDEVLRMVGTQLAAVGGGGRAYRYGGEEFAIVFPSVEVAQAIPALESLRETVAQTGFTVRRRLRPRKKPESPRANRRRRRSVITISIGVAEAGSRTKSAEQVLEAADRALYQAKERGRNRVVAG